MTVERNVLQSQRLFEADIQSSFVETVKIGFYSAAQFIKTKFVFICHALQFIQTMMIQKMQHDIC